MVSERTQTTTRDVTNDIHSQEQRLQEAVQAGHIVVTVAVPDSDVGLIIGKAGSTIKSIQDRTGANIQIPQSGDIDNPSIRTVSVTHPHAEGANLAKQLIEDILGSKRNQAPHVTIQVEIPDKGTFNRK
jgi:polyribonucleotide nucleotidyltransferase